MGVVFEAVQAEQLLVIAGNIVAVNVDTDSLVFLFADVGAVLQAEVDGSGGDNFLRASGCSSHLGVRWLRCHCPYLLDIVWKLWVCFTAGGPLWLIILPWVEAGSISREVIGICHQS